MMKLRTLTTALAGVALFALSANVAAAQKYDRETRLDVNETIEVPGATLPPGEYVLRVVDSKTNRHVVQVLNSTEDEVITTTIALNNRRLEPTDETEFAWYETPAGQPPALRAWFYPGDNFGQEFVYSEDRASELARSSKRNVMQTSTSTETTPVVEEVAILVATPLEAVSDDVETAMQQNQERDRAEPYKPAREPMKRREAIEPPSTQLAQAQPSRTAMPTDPDVPEPSELPQTAGWGALLALIGLGSLGGSAAVRKLRKS